MGLRYVYISTLADDGSGGRRLLDFGFDTWNFLGIGVVMFPGLGCLMRRSIIEAGCLGLWGVFAILEFVEFRVLFSTWRNFEV